MNDYKFVRNGLEDTYGILKLQDKILEIMVYIDKFCKEHNITYYLMGGSALGAMRHGGFIPWDDDLDIFMDYKNYKRFLNCCREYLDKEKFYLQEENTEELPYFFSKIRMNGTTCLNSVEGYDENVHHGIFVDVMCLNNAAPSEFGKKIQYYCAGLLKARAISKTNYKTDNKLKKVQLLVSKLLVNGPIKSLLLCMVRRYNKSETAEVAHIFGRAKYKNSFYPAEDFKSSRDVPFEQVVLSVPVNVENYLTLRYGAKYMEMPDEKTKATYQSHASMWDTEQDYSKILKEIKG